jgi:hypothetical protein
MHFDLNASEASRLLGATKTGETNLDQARVRYHHALENVETVATAATLTALRDAGRAYARAIVDHSCAAMDWLAFVEMSVRDAIPDRGGHDLMVRRNASGG